MTDLPNAALAYAVLDQIDKHLELWDQGQWLRRGEDGDCGTVGCFAGWTCLLSGDKPEWYGEDDPVTGWVKDSVGLRYLVDDRAEDLLGINMQQADRLFATSNTRDELIEFVAEIFGPRPEQSS